MHMSSHVICPEGVNKGFFSQGTRGHDIPYLCVVPSELTEREQLCVRISPQHCCNIQRLVS